MPTASIPLWALEGRGAKEWGNFESGTGEYFGHGLLGITRLGRLVAWSGDLEAYSYQELLLLLYYPRGSQVLSYWPTVYPKTVKRTCVLTGQLRFAQV